MISPICYQNYQFCLVSVNTEYKLEIKAFLYYENAKMTL